MTKMMPSPNLTFKRPDEKTGEEIVHGMNSFYWLLRCAAEHCFNLLPKSLRDNLWDQDWITQFWHAFNEYHYQFGGDMFDTDWQAVERRTKHRMYSLCLRKPLAIGEGIWC